MKRFSIRTLLLVVTLAALVASKYSFGYGRVFYQDSPQHGKLEIFGFQEDGQYKGRIRFTPAGGSSKDVHESLVLLFPEPVEERLSFQSVVDPATGNWFVCDENGHGLVVVVRKRPKVVPDGFRQLWHPGVHVGWMRGFWAKLYRDAKAVNPGMPYKGLPGEMKVESPSP